MNKNIPRVSIGVPIYNRETYIEQCVSSLFGQIYSNIEYVFVDDCSTDNSIEVLKKVAARFPERAGSFKIIAHDVNGGLWKARNSCIDNMTGEYFAFCDADDWLELDGIAKMVECAVNNDCDVVSTLLYENTDKQQSLMVFNSNKKEIFDLNNINLDVQHFSLCGKLFRSQLLTLNKLRVFEGINCWEDLCVVSRIFALTKKNIFLSEPFYHYRKSEQVSLSRSKNKVILEQHLICTDKLLTWFKNNKKDVEFSAYLKFLKFTAKIKMLRGRDKQVKRWKETYPESNIGIMKYRLIPFHYRILFSLVNILPTWFSQGICNLTNVLYKK